MNIAYRFGHNFACKGAVGIIDETEYNRKYGSKVIEYLQRAGHNCIDCTPPDMPSSSEELYYGVNKVNELNADLFLSFHLNAYEYTERAIGAECEVYPNNKITIDIGNRILNNLQQLGFKNRGVKERTNLYELNNTNCPAMILEPLFVDSVSDYNLFNQHGIDKVALVIAEGIHGSKINIEPVKPAQRIVEYDITRPEGSNIYPIGAHSYIEETTDGRTIIHNDRGNYISIGKGFIDYYWNDNKGNIGSKRLSE